MDDDGLAPHTGPAEAKRRSARVEIGEPKRKGTERRRKTQGVATKKKDRTAKGCCTPDAATKTTHMGPPAPSAGAAITPPSPPLPLSSSVFLLRPALRLSHCSAPPRNSRNRNANRKSRKVCQATGVRVWVRGVPSASDEEFHTHAHTGKRAATQDATRARSRESHTRADAEKRGKDKHIKKNGRG